MKLKKLFLLFCTIAFTQIVFGQVYRTQSLSENIHTIQINASGDWRRSPIIDMHSNDFIQLSFDELMDSTSHRLLYKVVYCNADWTPSSLSDIEYLDGFNNRSIDDYALSMNTTMSYTNYHLTLPNNDVKLKLSGNYAILVYGDDDPNKILLTACFSLVKTDVSIAAQVTTNTDIDSNGGHQQLSFSINYGDLQSATQ